MFQFLAHTQDLGSGIQFYTVPDPFQSERFKREFLALGLADTASHLSDSDSFHITLLLSLSR